MHGVRLNPRPYILAGLALTFVLTLLFWATDLDLTVASLAYSPQPPNWPYDTFGPWRFLYLYGTRPALVLGILSGLAFGLSWKLPALKPLRFQCLYLFLLLALGPGLLVNLIAKDLFGRPRPEETALFNGTRDFLRPFQFGTPYTGRSFLSGHCSMAFWFLGFFFLDQARRRWLWLSLATLFGLAMGAARIAQGAHFLSDCLLCGAVLFTLAAALSPVARWRPREKTKRHEGSKRAFPSKPADRMPRI